MSKFIKYALLLAVIGVLCAAGVAGVYVATEDRVRANEQSQRDESLKIIFGADATFEAVPAGTVEDPIWAARSADGTLLGYATVGEKQGYSSELKVLVGVDPTVTTVLGIKVLFQQETPGLGANVAEKEKENLWAFLKRITRGGEPPEEKAYSRFESQFVEDAAGKKRALPIERAKLKNDGDIDAMTAATITSNAVVNAVQNAAKRLQEQLKDTTTP